jgi:hypothetical protein
MRILLIALISCCAPAPVVGPRHADEIIARGGELRDEAPERAMRVTPALVSVWGITEVPATARLQTALAGVDAITRSELLKAIEVRVSSVATAVDSTDPSRSSVVVETREAVAGMLARAAPLPHGWVRLRRDGRLILRLWARLDVRRDELENTLRAPLARSGQPPNALVEGLTLTTPLGDDE